MNQSVTLKANKVDLERDKTRESCQAHCTVSVRRISELWAQLKGLELESYSWMIVWGGYESVVISG